MADQVITVALTTLRDEATIWDQQSDLLHRAAVFIGDIHLANFASGLFEPMMRASDKAAAVLSERCREGQRATTEVGTALRTVADVYEAEEQITLHRITGLG